MDPEPDPPALDPALGSTWVPDTEPPPWAAAFTPVTVNSGLLLE